MRFWLLKTEPETWSWDLQQRRGSAGEVWSGVRNHQAKGNLAKMQLGERAFFYHSGKERSVVGIVTVIKTAFADPTDPSGRFLAVTVRSLAALPRPVTLGMVKNDTRLRDMVLVNNTRLSVQPVTEAEWAIVCQLSSELPLKSR